MRGSACSPLHSLACSTEGLAFAPRTGIISALAPSAQNGLLAAGSYSGTVGLYDLALSEPLTMTLGVPHGSGVTQVRANAQPRSCSSIDEQVALPLCAQVAWCGTYLFVASRRSLALDIFDLRNPLQPLTSVPRRAMTHQRLSFDLVGRGGGALLAMGDQHGLLSFHDVASVCSTPEGMERVPKMQEKVANDALGSTAFVRGGDSTDYLITCSGSRKLDRSLRLDIVEDASTSSSSDGEREIEEPEQRGQLCLWQLR